MKNFNIWDLYFMLYTCLILSLWISVGYNISWQPLFDRFYQNAIWSIWLFNNSSKFNQVLEMPLSFELSYIRPHISMAFWQVSPGISYWHGFSKVINDAFWRDHWYSYNQHFIAEEIIKFLIILVLEAVDERANVHCTNNWFSEIWS